MQRRIFLVYQFYALDTPHIFKNSYYIHLLKLIFDTTIIIVYYNKYETRSVFQTKKMEILKMYKLFSCSLFSDKNKEYVNGLDITEIFEYSDMSISKSENLCDSLDFLTLYA